jgi:hypothetical protein
LDEEVVAPPPTPLLAGRRRIKTTSLGGMDGLGERFGEVFSPGFVWMVIRHNVLGLPLRSCGVSSAKKGRKTVFLSLNQRLFFLIGLGLLSLYRGGTGWGMNMGDRDNENHK